MPDGMDWGEMETVGDLADEEKKDMVWHFVIMMRFRSSGKSEIR